MLLDIYFYMQGAYIMKYFNFDQLNPITRYLNNSSLEEQIYSYQHWFNFRIINEKSDQIESWLLLIPLFALAFVWIKMFAWYDKT